MFVRDIILPIKYNVGWVLIRQKNQAQINKDNNCKNIKIVYYDYKVGDKVMLKNKAA